MINQEFPAVHPIGKNDTAIEMAIRRSSEKDQKKERLIFWGFGRGRMGALSWNMVVCFNGFVKESERLIEEVCCAA
jgi:hypothetical protein